MSPQPHNFIPRLISTHARVDGTWNNLEWGITAGEEEQGRIPWMHMGTLGRLMWI